MIVITLEIVSLIIALSNNMDWKFTAYPDDLHSFPSSKSLVPKVLEYMRNMGSVFRVTLHKQARQLLRKFTSRRKLKWSINYRLKNDPSKFRATIKGIIPFPLSIINYRSVQLITDFRLSTKASIRKLFKYFILFHFSLSSIYEWYKSK